MQLMFAYQHTQGSTPRAHWWSWCREIDSALQSRWSPHPYIYRSYRGWSLQTSCCPQYVPLLHTHNLRGKIKSLVKLFLNFFLPVEWSIYLYSVDSRLLDQSPDAYKAAWDTQETHTAPHLPARLRLALEHKERWRYEWGKRQRWRSQTWQVQVEQWFELRVHVCPSLNSCPSSVHTITRDRQETMTEIMIWFVFFMFLCVQKFVQVFVLWLSGGFFFPIFINTWCFLNLHCRNW